MTAQIVDILDWNNKIYTISDCEQGTLLFDLFDKEEGEPDLWGPQLYDVTIGNAMRL